MAEPKIEDGHIDFANELAEFMAGYRISGEEWQVLLVIMRKTWGWHKAWDRIAMRQFCDLTDLPKGSVCRAVNKLRLKNIIRTKKQGIKTLYHINSHYSDWNRTFLKYDREKIFKRDGYKCFWCKKVFLDDELEVDHKKALAEGGSNIETNLVTSCQTCNRQRGIKTAGLIDLGNNSDTVTKKRLRSNNIETSEVAKLRPQTTVKRGTSQQHRPPKETITKETITKEKTSVDLSKNVAEIFSFWKHHLNHPKALLTEDRKRKIGARLKESYTVDQCQDAIKGCKLSAYHMGDNPQGKIYDTIELIFRNGDKIEQFINICKEVLKHGKTGKRSKRDTRAGWEESDKYRHLYRK